MSKIANEVFERLRNCEPYSKIRASVPSVARFTDGVKQYLTWASVEVERLQKAVAEQDTRHQELIGLNKTLAVQNEGLKTE